MTHTLPGSPGSHVGGGLLPNAGIRLCPMLIKLLYVVASTVIGPDGLRGSASLAAPRLYASLIAYVNHFNEVSLTILPGA